MTEVNNWKLLELEEDEAEHNKKVYGEIRQHLELANAASALSLNGLVSLREYPRVNEPEGLVSLLVAKAARNVRFAVYGLKLGYYTGTSAVLRAAYDSLLYAVLFHSDPAQVAIWFRNELSSRPDNELSPLRCEQRNKAKIALLNFENSHSIKDTMNEFVDKANIRIHSNVLGLSEEFNVDMDYLMPDELEHMISECNEGFDRALDRYAFMSSFGKNLIYQQLPSEKEVEKEETLEVQLAIKYDEDTINDLSLFAFYIGHRLLEFTKFTFDVQDKDFNDYYNEWRKAIEEIGETR